DGTWLYDDFFHGRSVLEQHANWDHNITLRGGWVLGLTPSWYGIAFDQRRYGALGITRINGARADTIPFEVSDRVRVANITRRARCCFASSGNTTPSRATRCAIHRAGGRCWCAAIRRARTRRRSRSPRTVFGWTVSSRISRRRER